jgi:hypothetical protein
MLDKKTFVEEALLLDGDCPEKASREQKLFWANQFDLAVRNLPGQDTVTQILFEDVVSVGVSVETDSEILSRKVVRRIK